MTIFGASWGLRLRGVDPLAKLVAIRLGDYCDTEGQGNADIDDLAEWCCAPESDVIAALTVLQSVADVEWRRGQNGRIIYQLPDSALPDRRGPAAGGQEKRLTIYVISGARGTKVGITSDLEQRTTGLRQATLDDSVQAQWSTSGPASIIRRAERRAHELLASKLIRNEWFTASIQEAIAAVKAALAEPKSDS